MEHFVTVIFDLFRGLGVWGAMLSMFVENLGIPLPTEIGYLIAQNLVNTGRVAYPLILIVLTIGHVAGSIISYLIGRAGDSFVTKKLKENSRIREVRGKLKKWYAKYGNLTVFLARFVGYVRPWSSFVAGFSEVPFWPFLIWTTLGSLIFNVFTLYFTGIVIMIWRRYASFHFWIIVIGLILFSGLLIYGLASGWLKKKKSSK